MHDLNRIVAQLNDRSPIIGKRRRKKAILELGKIGTKEVVTHLVSALSDEDKEVKRVAFSSLSGLSNQSAISELCRLYLEKKDKKVWEIISRKDFVPQNPKERLSFYILTGQVARCIPPNKEYILPLTELLIEENKTLQKEGWRILATTKKEDRERVFAIYFSTLSPALKDFLVKEGWLPTKNTERLLFYIFLEKEDEALRIERREQGSFLSGYKELYKPTKERLINILIRNPGFTPLLSQILSFEKERSVVKKIFFGLAEREHRLLLEFIREKHEEFLIEMLKKADLSVETLLRIGITKGGYLLCMINGWLEKRGFRPSEPSIAELMNNVAKVSKELISVSIKALSAGEESEKKKACEILGKMEAEEAVEPLISLLENENRVISQSAKNALARIKSKKVTPALVKLFEKGDWRLRVAVSYILGKRGSKKAQEFLVKAVSKEGWGIQEDALKALAKIGGNISAKPLIAALRYNNIKIRQIAAAGLGNLRDKQAIRPLVRALQDRDWKVRTLAAYSLSKIEEESLLDTLLIAFEKPVWYVKEASLKAMGKLGTKKVVDLLIESALNDEEDEVRQTATIILGKIEAKRAAKPLIKILQDESPGVRQAVCATLCRLGDGRGYGTLIDVLRSGEWQEKMRAACVLSKLDTQEVIQALSELTKDADHQVRMAAVVTFGKMRSTKCIPQLLSTWSAEVDIDAKARIVQSLGRIGSPKGLRVLTIALGDRNPKVREESVFGIGKMRAKEGIPPLIKALNDEEPSVRRKALLSLRLLLGEFGQELQEKELVFIKNKVADVEVNLKGIEEMSEYLLLKLQLVIVDHIRKGYLFLLSENSV